MKNYKTVAPSFSTVVRNPWLMLTTFFGSGCITPGPGTWGSFAAWLAFVVLESVACRPMIWVLTVFCLLLGAWAIPKCEPVLKKMDHGSIVIDEVVAVWLVLLLSPIGWIWQLAGVLVFRFFDIVKLPPASTLDAGVQTGWTVMIDDLIAAFYSLVVITVSALVLMYCFDIDITWKII